MPRSIGPKIGRSKLGGLVQIQGPEKYRDFVGKAELRRNPESTRYGNIFLRKLEQIAKHESRAGDRWSERCDIATTEKTTRTRVVIGSDLGNRGDRRRAALLEK